MFKIILYILLSILINCMVIGEPTWQLLTSKLWIFISAIVVVFVIGLKIYEVEHRPIKTFGAALMILSVVGFVGFCFVPPFRHYVCWYLGIDNVRALFEFYDHLSGMQITVIGICETVLAMFLLQKNEDKAKDGE